MFFGFNSLIHCLVRKMDMPRTDGHIEIHSIGCLWFVYYCLLFVASLSLTFYGSLYFLACLLFIVCESNGPLSSGTTFILCRTWDINVLWHYDECLFCLYRIGGTDPQSFVCVCLYHMINEFDSGIRFTFLYTTFLIFASTMALECSHRFSPFTRDILRRNESLTGTVNM